ncbi:D-inositol 3-phosphate glycosyltransferase [Tritonibacter multivorans]|uniref:D-inositol 3-phosphate glycosyltransferase n=1 Tax=Tritonibacter multivorans TaxID=928856 RepID=A0A0N7LZV7_9RHOB|nr:glycosyltransferase family 1 protein [Tritonibacter multivorans]MDA7421980.1 glycosyltransferase family 1 protein [Tritonibacter multivorans]CUH78737.1 D-inositol 3-phosphate glycosyltransferase [Tritonibacter multivorans]SFD68232.1 Glycosyl transferases group 1 [Tritonibacter multivorans]
MTFRTMRRLYINGRFLGGAPTAVNMVARDLSLALCRAESDWDVRLVVPSAQMQAAAGLGVAYQVLGRHDGIRWEQTELPKLSGKGVVAGFFNTVPVLGRGYVTLLHDAHVYTTPQSYSRATVLWRRLLLHRAAAVGNFILTPSVYSRDQLLAQKVGDKDQYGVACNGISPLPAKIDRDFPRRLGLSCKDYALGVGNLMPHKNMDFLFKVFAQQTLSEVPLVLFGNTTREDFEQAGFVLPKNIVFAGRVSDAERAGLYENALATLVPSLEEGFGLPALEAMQAGSVPIVAKRGALPEVVGNAGIVLPVDRPAVWSDALLRLRAEPELRHHLEEAGQARAATQTWEAAAQSVLGHLEVWFHRKTQSASAVEAAFEQSRTGAEQAKGRLS